MGLIGPNLNLIPDVNPGDGRFEVVWIGTDHREEWREYLKELRDGIESTPPIPMTRCHQIVFRHVDAPAHIDGKSIRQHDHADGRAQPNRRTGFAGDRGR
jgi:hypothetical protein